MKECCITGDKDPGINMKKRIIRILWAAALLLVLAVGLIQIFTDRKMEVMNLKFL